VVESNQHGNGLILRFAWAISDEFINKGIESGFALYERIHTDLLTRFQGSAEELTARLEALERGFLKGADEFAEISAAILMVASPHYTPQSDVCTLTDLQTTVNARIENEAAKLTSHIQNMFRNALAFHKATGSFTGFLDSAEANQEGKMSLRDVELAPRAILSEGGRNGAAHENVSNISGLSSAGRDFLQRFYKIA
jgi:hypothetical protein